jgi:hypothetical protein
MLPLQHLKDTSIGAILRKNEEDPRGASNRPPLNPFQPARLILTVGEPLFIGNPFGGWWYAFNGAGKMGWVHNLYVSPLWDELPPLYAHYCAPILL